MKIKVIDENDYIIGLYEVTISLLIGKEELQLLTQHITNRGFSK